MQYSNSKFQFSQDMRPLFRRVLVVRTCVIKCYVFFFKSSISSVCFLELITPSNILGFKSSKRCSHYLKACWLYNNTFLVDFELSLLIKFHFNKVYFLTWNFDFFVNFSFREHFKWVCSTVQGV
jgi:hypothetical protein